MNNIEKKESNPSLQCSVCGQWKRLHGKDENNKAIQRFYSCCGVDNIEHEKDVCAECCDKYCKPKFKLENL